MFHIIVFLVHFPCLFKAAKIDLVNISAHHSSSHHKFNGHRPAEIAGFQRVFIVSSVAQRYYRNTPFELGQRVVTVELYNT